jgi:hypothetical protein
MTAIGETPGTLDARWSYENVYSGSGLATGGPKQGFVGDFHIRYFLEDGEFSDEYDLQIRRAGPLYDVTWLTDGAIAEQVMLDAGWVGRHDAAPLGIR